MVAILVSLKSYVHISVVKSFLKIFCLSILDCMVPILLCCSCLGWLSMCHHMLLAFLVPTPLLVQTSSLPIAILTQSFDVFYGCPSKQSSGKAALGCVPSGWGKWDIKIVNGDHVSVFSTKRFHKIIIINHFSKER